MRYTPVPKTVAESLEEYSWKYLKLLDLWRARKDITYFSTYFLDLKPYTYQHWIFKELSAGVKRVIICKSRQIGISVAVAVMALHAACFNKHPSGIHNNTKVCIVSKSDDQAKKLMGEIKKLIYKGDLNMKKRTAGKIYRFFRVAEDKESPNNRYEITFTDGCSIKCFPPTDSIRGESADLVIVDEAAFVEEEVFTDAIEPTVSATNGIIILSSTPRGQKGFFFNLFDPFDVHKEHEYKRFWFNWHMCENDDQKELICEKKRLAEQTGQTKSFDQEYNAMFTIDEEAFFESEDVDKSIHDLPKKWEEKILICSVGIDYGVTKCATVITIVGNDGEKTYLLNQYAKVNMDESLLLDPNFDWSIPNIMKRFKVKHIIVDDCVQGTRTNRDMEEKGYPVKRFNFRSDQADRNKGYYLFRSALKQGKVLIYDSKELVAEMKALQEISMKVNTAIRKPVGGSDDRVDSLMMACLPFLEEQSVFKSILVNYSEIDEKEKDPRYDSEWEKLVGV